MPVFKRTLKVFFVSNNRSLYNTSCDNPICCYCYLSLVCGLRS